MLTKKITKPRASNCFSNKIIKKNTVGLSKAKKHRTKKWKESTKPDYSLDQTPVFL